MVCAHPGRAPPEGGSHREWTPGTLPWRVVNTLCGADKTYTPLRGATRHNSHLHPRGAQLIDGGGRVRADSWRGTHVHHSPLGELHIMHFRRTACTARRWLGGVVSVDCYCWPLDAHPAHPAQPAWEWVHPAISIVGALLSLSIGRAGGLVHTRGCGGRAVRSCSGVVLCGGARTSGGVGCGRFARRIGWRCKGGQCCGRRRRRTHAGC